MAKPQHESVHDEIQRLAMARDNGSISRDQEERLELLVLNDQQASKIFADHLLQTVSLRNWAIAQTELTKAEDIQAEKEKKLPWVTLGRLHPWRHPVRFGATVLSLTLVFWLAFLFLVSPRFSDRPDIARGGRSAVVAELTGVQDVTWGEGQLLPHQGAFLVRGRKLELKAGLAEITFRSGAVVIVEGPAVLQIQSPLACKLSAGTVNATVPEAAHGFAIVTPVASVVDLGTAFGVTVEDDGSSNVDVFVGKVRVEPEDSDTYRDLVAGEIARVDARGRLSGQRNVVAHVRRLPALAGVSASEFIAYQVAHGTVGNQEFGGSVGHDFIVQRPIKVTRLGAFDSGADGLQRTITVEIWRRDDRGTPSATSDDQGLELVVRREFSAGGRYLLAGSNRMDMLDAPINLARGPYTIVAHGYGQGELLGNADALATYRRLNTGAGAISFVGTGRFGKVAGDFPAIPDSGPSNRYCAGTFAFTSKNRESE